MAAVVGLQAVVARSATDADERIGQALATLFGWAPVFWRAVIVVALALAIVVDAVVRRRWLLVRDVAIALLVVNVAAGILALTVDLARAPRVCLSARCTSWLRGAARSSSCGWP